MAEFSNYDWSSVGSPEVISSAATLSASLIIDASATNIQDEVAKLASGSGVKASALRGAISEIVSFYSLGQNGGWTSSKLGDHLKSIQCPDNVSSVVVRVWQENQGRITASSLTKTLKANQLVDMDWVFGVTASSDTCNEVGKTYLQLKLTFDQNVGNGGKNMHLEMTVDQFFAFLSSMEQCKQFLEYTSAAKGN